MRHAWLGAVLWRMVLPASAGALGSLALPPTGLWIALPAAFGALVWLLDRVAHDEAAMGRRCRQAGLVGWSFGFGWFLASLTWIAEAFRVEADLFAWLIPFALTLLPAGLALYWGAAAALAMRWWRGSGRDVLFLVAALSLAEWLRGHLLTGFPWNLPGYVADASDAVAQGAAVVGIYGLTALVLLWAMIPALLWRPGGAPAPRLALLAAATLGLSWAGGTWRLAQAAPEPSDSFTVSIVQASIPQGMKWQRNRKEEILERYLALTASLANEPNSRRHVVVWPETAVPFLVGELPDVRQRVAAALPQGAVLVLGAFRREPPVGKGEPFRVFNSVLVMDPVAEIAAAYDKWRLVPFGEFLPLEGVLAPWGLRKLVPVPLSFTAGEGERAVAAAGLPPFVPLVCYEAIFPLSPAGNEKRPLFLVNVTNDAWFGTSAGPAQHLAHARFRAIESGLPLVRAANTGISAVIDARGEVVRRLGLGEVGTLTAPLPPPATLTPYARFGDLLFAGLLLVLVAGASRPAGRR